MLALHALLDLLLRPRRAWAVALVSLFLGLLVAGLLGEASHRPAATDQLPAGADSTRVVQLEERFPAKETSTAIALFSSDRRIPAADLPALQSRFRAVAGPSAPPLSVSKDGTAALGVLPVPGNGATQVAAEVGRIRAELRADLPAGVTAQLTGPAAVQADLAAVFKGANFRLLAVTATVVAVLLIVTYRSPVLWLVPLFVVGVADRAAAALSTHVLAALGVAWDESTVGILSVLVFGAGTDYALLLISRYRDELKTQEDRYVAMRHALWRTAEAVLSSAVTVVAALLTLLLSLIPTTRGLGLACAVGIVVAATAALVALPFTLVLFGRWIFWPRTPRLGQPTLVESRSWWHRVGDQVARRPGAFVVTAVVALAVLASGLLGVRTGLSPADQFLKKPEAIAAAQRLAESFPAGGADPATVVTAAPVDRVSRTILAVPGVASVRPTGSAGNLSRLDVVLDAAPGSRTANQTVLRVRTALTPYAETVVGGTEAADIDAKTAAARDRLLLLPLILAVVLGALVLLLRSVVAPLILVGTVVLTYLAALGVSWWLFSTVFGFERLDVGVPLLAFLFLVALGVDYNIFLVARAAEEAPGHGAREGMLRALTATGGVITSAGILLAAVFAVLGVLPLVVLAQLGVVICVGVLLDTLVVRTVLVPAIALRLGDAFWWPRLPGSRGAATPPSTIPGRSTARV